MYICAFLKPFISKIREMISKSPGILFCSMMMGLLAVLFLCVMFAPESSAVPVSYQTIKYVPVKRNTWWSKKSITEDTNNDKTESATWPEITATVALYIDNCVTSFVTCARAADSDAQMNRCKQQYRDCSIQCFQDSKELLTLVNDMN